MPPSPVLPNKTSANKDLSGFSRSGFTLTFAVEIVNTDIWNDHKEGWVEIGPCLDGIKFQYDLYYGQSFLVEVAIYAQVAKITRGQDSCWVRTWQYLERRWLTFSIRHAFPVRVMDLRDFEVIVSVTPGLSGLSSIAKTTIGNEILFPRLEFGVKRYFGSLIEEIPTEKQLLEEFIIDWIWSLVVPYIPASSLDGEFDIPFPVADIRHQDTIMFEIQTDTLTSKVSLIGEDEELPENEKKDKLGKEKTNKKPEKKASVGFGLKLSGDKILAGTGRIVSFEAYGEKPPEVGKIIILISSANLPAYDDVPIVFVNIGQLFDAPLEEFRKNHITHLYTQWTLGDEIQNSEYVDITRTNLQKINFKDGHALPLMPSSATEVTATFLDKPYCIQLRGRRCPPPKIIQENLFGYDPLDRDFGKAQPPPIIQNEKEQDTTIAVTKIDGRSLARGLNSFINGEYPLYPPPQSVSPLSREAFCTNDLNLIRVPLEPELIVPANVIIAANMTLEVSLGVVGCKPPKITSCFSRLFCIISDPVSIMEILIRVRSINDELAVTKSSAMLTGFALDTGDNLILFVEGPRDGNILKIWDMTEGFYPRVKPVFSTSSRYAKRVYPEFLEAIMPFIVLKSYVPLELVLACPAVYVRPALPIPARIAALKFGRILQQSYRTIPSRCDLPTAAELKSFRLELCAPTRTQPVLHSTHEKDTPKQMSNNKKNSIGPYTKINWENKEKQT